MKIYTLSILFFVSLVNATDDNLALEDYAKGIELITESKASIYQFSLPEQVYRHIINTNMSDIRVFNQEHEPVPHVIKQYKDDESTSETLELPYFPLPFDEITLLDNKFDVTVSSAGKVIRIQSADEITDEGNNSAKYYLIDASHIEYIIDSIDFKINGKTSDYAKKIKLESSNDLNNWNLLVRNATLTELEYGNYALKKMRVELPNRKIKYLRFTWLDDADGLFIDSIKANFKKYHVDSKKIWATARVVNKNIEQAIYEFDTGGLFNIEQINIELPQDNTLIDVLIESRFSKDSEWEDRYKGTFYKLYINDTEITREPVSLHSAKHRYWRIKLQSTDGIGRAEPSLKYAWRSNDLYFLARGNGPFILAYGNANVNNSIRTPGKLMSIVNKDTQSEMVAVAIAGREITLKGDLALVAKKELPWQRILLWLVLIIGVLVIAIMAFRLIKQMGTNAL
jgi:uncharacterized protein DUF3999